MRMKEVMPPLLEAFRCSQERDKVEKGRGEAEMGCDLHGSEAEKSGDGDFHRCVHL